MIRYYWICLLMVTGIRSQLALNECIELINYDIAQSTSGMARVNPDGPLNLLRGYFYYKNGLIQNKRDYSSGINSLFSLKYAPEGRVNNPKYSFTPGTNPVEYFSNTKTVRDHYLSEFNACLINMFFDSGSNSIMNRIDTRTFTGFLKNLQPNSSDGYKILAALFLLSEGIDIPITVEKIEGQYFIILRNIRDDTEVFNICIDESLSKPMECANNTTNLSHSILRIIEFFIINRTNPMVVLNNVSTEPAAYSDFKKAGFLNTPRFLIQAYIYDFLDCIDKAQDFIYIVYTMLEEIFLSDDYMLMDNEERKMVKSIFIRCFSFENAVWKKSYEYLYDIVEIEKILNRNSILPFSDAYTLPTYTRIPKYSNIRNNFLIEEEYFDNSVEAAILGIMCCLAYDPETKKYTTKNMQFASDELKWFFNKYKIPNDETSFEMHRDWNKIVSNLSDPHIKYSQNGNQLVSGILNIIRVIQEITGVPEKDKEYIELCIEKMTLNNTLVQSFIRKIEEYVLGLIMSLSTNKDVSVSFGKIEKRFIQNTNTSDVFGNIAIRYRFNGLVSGLNVGIFNGGASLTLKVVNTYEITQFISNCLNTRNKYMKDNRFISCLLINYIDILVNSLRSYLSNISSMMHVAREIYMCDNIEQIFLWGRISDLQYKKNLIKFLSLIFMNEKMSPNDNAFRVISNLLGSIPLCNLDLQLEIIPYIVYGYTWTNLEKNIICTEIQYVDILNNSLETGKLFMYIVDMHTSETLICSLRLFINLRETSLTGAINPLLHSRYLMKIIQHLFVCDNIDNLQILRDLIKSKWKFCDYVNDIITLAWFVCACTDPQTPYPVLKNVYDLVNKQNDTWYLDRIQAPEKYLEVVSVLERLRNKLKTRKGKETKLNRLICLFKQTKSSPERTSFKKSLTQCFSTPIRE
ncbi:hypothetical protein NEPAR06_2061 [Nematocida parisii]|uniref:Uncharacterized protein n=1 Tax=Nematocida parisii (strain ERTm3) TaxID=935791 RepID=I3EDK1_NEMP3|nr:hypothetical protein NEQG_02421 [Nematocida parisii ERTm3]KAI5143847.1 hypothetical protein NEPAR07_0896 [Nematocida parisii]KAI5155851.1 hypothetical protein NEPAR06_2061 [Nematocida parisii]KAI5156649.1 hypothetical protein NEPAR05_0716 [Nematocida parisii]